METLQVDRDNDEVIDESKKIDEINEGIKQFKNKCQGIKTNQEKKEFVEKFNEFVSSYGPAYELKVFVTMDGPIIAGKASASAAFLSLFEEMDSKEISKCFEECTKAFGKEFQKYLKEYKEKGSVENRHCIH